MNKKLNAPTRLKPCLRFSPTAWAKLLYLRDLGPTEVGAFGITRADELHCVEDLQLVKQSCTAVSVVFDDDAVADFFDEQIDQGRTPSQFGRIWIHTHPGDCPRPSGVDEETFQRVFGGPDWAVMFILAQGGQTYARLQFNVGPGGSLRIPVELSLDQPFQGTDFKAWRVEYVGSVTIKTWSQQPATTSDDQISTRIEADWSAPSHLDPEGFFYGF